MKTPPILLKLLHNSAAKASPKFNKTASRNGDGGFTLLEVLVIALIIGIFSSIAAPSWQAFITRQRVRTVNDRVLQTLRTAQSEAKRTKRNVTIVFNTNTSTPPVDPPTVTIAGNTQQLNTGGEIKAKQILLSTNAAGATPANSITFDYLGNPSRPSFVVTVSPVGGGTKQCAIVETLIGGMRTAEGTGCP